MEGNLQHRGAKSQPLPQHREEAQELYQVPQATHVARVFRRIDYYQQQARPYFIVFEGSAYSTSSPVVHASADRVSNSRAPSVTCPVK